MKFRIYGYMMMVSLAVLFIINSCKDSSSPSDSSNPSMNTVTKCGKLVMHDSSSIMFEDIKVSTFAGSADLNADGTFCVETPESDNYQMFYFSSKSNGNVFYIGLYQPAMDSVMANDSSTAIALTLFNPYLLSTDITKRSEFVEAVKQSNRFPQLLTLLNNSYQSDPLSALDYEANSNTYQTTVQIIRDVMQTLGQGGKDDKSLDPPYITDLSGGDINIVNPNQIWYAAGVYPDDGNLDDVVTINRVEDFTSFNWGWPPQIESDPIETQYNLGNGYYKLYITKGNNFSKISDWNDPEGRATAYNTAQLIALLTDLVIGNIDFLDFDLIEAFSDDISLATGEAFSLQEAINSGDVEAFIIALTEIITANRTAIAAWMWQTGVDIDQKNYLESTMNFLGFNALSMKFLGMTSQSGPFVWDLVYAPNAVIYHLIQSDGNIDSTGQNNPPEAEFSVYPPAGIVGTEFTFRGGLTTDDHDSLTSLLFRWDFDGDGSWDVDWISTDSATFTYTEAGSYSAILEVKDTEDLVGVMIHRVNVGGGAGTATHVKLFRDNLPWSSYAMTNMLVSLGFTEGFGPNTYEIILSTSMDSVQLIPGEDLVIISNDQNQTFYNNYAASQIKFTNFVYMGGSMFWEACDQGWAGGSMAYAGVVLPGNLTTVLDYDYWNYVTNQNLPLVSGLPDAMDHNFASHESFGNLQDGTTIYCIDESQNPTLIEYNLGGGWIIVTGQPLEHQYDNVYGAPDMAELLPRIVSYFTGQSISKISRLNPIKTSTRKTH